MDKRPDVSQSGDFHTSHHALDGVQLRGMLGDGMLLLLLPVDLLVVLQHLHHLLVSELHGVIDRQVPPSAQTGGKVMIEENFQQFILKV